MNMKKLIASTMACALAISLAAPAFAADTTVSTPGEDGTYSAKTEVAGTTEAPTISITVPQSGAVVVNPYKMTVKVDEQTNSTDQIISAPQYITNGSDVPISVSATVTGTVSDNSGIVFATSTLKGNETTKSIFMYLEIAKTSAVATPPSWAAAYDAKANNLAVVVGSKGTTKKDMVVMDATGGENAFAAFRLAGAVATNPAKAWTSTDAVTVSIAYTFAPTVVASGS